MVENRAFRSVSCYAQTTPVENNDKTAVNGVDDSFLICPENELAVRAIARLRENRSDDALKSVYIYGSAGVGKSDLISWLAQQASNIRCVSTSGGTLVQEFDEAVSANELPRLRERWSGSQLFLCEDVGGLTRRLETQRLVMSVVDDVLAAGGAVCFSGNRSPGQLEGFHPRFISRLHAAACLPMLMPGYGSRQQLLTRFLGQKNLSASEGVVGRLASSLAVSPRELLAAVGALAEHSARRGSRRVELSDVEEFLREQQKPRGSTVAEVARVTAREFGVKVSQLRQATRTSDASLARQVAMALARELTAEPLISIANYFGRSDHGTVSHAIRRLAERLQREPELRQHVSRVRSRLTGFSEPALSGDEEETRKPPATETLDFP